MNLNVYYLNRYTVDYSVPEIPERYLASPIDQSVIDSVVFFNPITNAVEDSLTHALKNPMLADSMLATMSDTSQPSEYGSDEDKLATLKPRNCQSAAETKLYLESLREYADNISTSDDIKESENKPDSNSDVTSPVAPANNAGGDGN